MNIFSKATAKSKSVSVWSEDALQSTTFYSALILLIILLFSWPDRMIYRFVLNDEIPKIFSIVSISIVLLISLISFRFGRVEAKKVLDELPQPAKTDETTRKSEPWFFVILSFQFVMHTLLLSVLFFPMLLPGVAISRLSWLDLAKTIAIIYSTALLFRVFGFSVFLFLRKREILDTLISSLLFFFSFLFTAIWFDFANPLVLIYHLNYSREVIAPVPIDAFSFYHIIVSALILLLAMVCYLKIHYKGHNKFKP